MTLSLTKPTNRLWTDAPQLTGLTVFIALTALPVALAMGLDDRVFQGENIWLKPLKFHVALAIYTLTLAFYARFLPPGTLCTPRWRMYQNVITAAIVAELLWVGTAAAMGTASHFNTTTLAWNIAYGAMGMAAVTLTSISLVMGLTFWRHAGTLSLALALGLILTFVLTVIVAGTMSSGAGHHIGTPVTGAALPVVGWSREVGDLRVSHFLATHALHAVPLAALTRVRVVVWAAAFGYCALTLGTFGQALMGWPLI